MAQGLNAFVTEHSNLFALLLGVMIFYNFTPASNPAVRSLLWLFSSLIAIFLMTYLFYRAFYWETSVGTKFSIGLPIFLIDLVFTMQVLISLFEPKNMYALNVVSELFTFRFWLNVIISSIIIGVIVLIIFLLRKKEV